MKRFMILLLTAAAALLLFTGCVPAEQPESSGSEAPDTSSSASSGDGSQGESEQPENPDGSTPPDQGQEGDKPDTKPSQPEEDGKEPLSEDGEQTARQAYAKVLLNLLNDHVFPDGRSDNFDSSYSMADNRFAVCDVDGDGREELVLEYVSTSVAAHRGLVMDYDPKEEKVRIQLDEYPAPAFFDNGAVLVHWSHNQGKGGAFWPYSLYIYRPEQDSYSFVGSVDAWDSSIDTENYPKDVDTSKSGFVYYISSGASQEGAAPVDASDYQAWLDPYIGKADIIQVDFKSLTEENIRQITDDVTQETGENPAP